MKYMARQFVLCFEEQREKCSYQLLELLVCSVVIVPSVWCHAYLEIGVMTPFKMRNRNFHGK